MTDFTARITEILLAPVEGNGADRLYLNFNGYRLPRSTAAHVAALIAEAAEQHYRPRLSLGDLESAPVGTIVRAGPDGWTFELMPSGWWGIGYGADYLDVNRIPLPATLLWSPGAGE